MKKLPLAALLLALLLGCASPIHVTKDTVSSYGMFGEIRRLCTTCAILGPVDDAYESFSYAEWQARIPCPTIETRANAWDCDDYALDAMVQTRKKYRLEATSDTTPAIGIAAGYITDGLLGIAGSGEHALNIIHVKGQGWVFYEPQTGQTALVRVILQENKFKIHWVMF